MTVGILGFGRFGQLLAQLLVDKFDIIAYDKHFSENNNLKNLNKIVCSDNLADIGQCETIFIAVPIRQFETSLKALCQHLTANATIIDVCSVKIYPVNLMLDYLPKTVGIIATHPLFGPDSINNPESRKIMMSHIRGLADIYQFWKTFFQNKNINIIEMTPGQHDELAAKSQSITHFIGRVLDDAQFEPTDIDTQGFQKLLKLKQQTCNDSWELFFDLQRYNPYSKEYINKFLNSANIIYQKILDNE